MSDQEERRQEASSPTLSPVRRERAPTITIDTSAVSPSSQAAPSSIPSTELENPARSQPLYLPTSRSPTTDQEEDLPARHLNHVTPTLNDQEEHAREASSPTPLPVRVRRERAPTITIDTSAVSSSQAPSAGNISSDQSSNLSRPQPSRTLTSDAHQDEGSSPVGFSPIDIQPKHSFELSNSRPNSPRNISSPTHKPGPQLHTFLSVPSNRSRVNSVDSSDMAPSPTSYGGETYLPSHTGSSQNGDTSSRLDTAASTAPLINEDDDHPLKPLPGTEHEFVIENNKFAFTPGHTGKLFPKNNAVYHALGGLSGLERGLRADRHAGLGVDEHELQGTVSFEEAVATRPEAPTASGSDDTPDPTNTAEQNLDITNTSDARPDPISDHEQRLGPATASEETPHPTSHTEQKLDPTSASEKTPDPTDNVEQKLDHANASDGRPGPSSNSEQEMDHMSLATGKYVRFSKHQRPDPTGSSNQRPTPPKQGDTGASGTMRHENAYADRIRVFGDNRLPDKKSKTLLQLMWLAFNDKMLLLLTGCAIISLILGFVNVGVDTNGPKPDEPGRNSEWIEGLAILIAVVVVVAVGALNDWQKEKKFIQLSKKSEERLVNVIRSGASREISIHDLVVGDVVHLEPGDVVPCDGVLIKGHGVKCDESSQTGESDVVKKIPGDEAFAAIEQNGPDNPKIDPFLISGSKVQEGTGTFLCTGVGVNSSHGKIMMTLHEESQSTPLQAKLNNMAEWIAKLGLAAGSLLLLVTFIRYIVEIAHATNGTGRFANSTPLEKGFAFLQLFITAVTIVVVAVPEGLPLAVTLALAFATRRLMKLNNLVRIFKACETMGNATTICSDKTGTLTTNKMTVSKLEFTANCMTTAPDLDEISSEVKELTKESILINSSAFEGEVDGKSDFIGSKTEAALLNYARQAFNMGPLAEERANRQIVQVDPFDSKRKCMGTAVRLSDGRYRLYVKGAAELVLDRCTHLFENPYDGVQAVESNSTNKWFVRQTIERYADESLRTIATAYREFESWPPAGLPTKKDDPAQADFDELLSGMTLAAIFGIQDPLRPGVPESVAICQKAGVKVRMVTGDNLHTAKAIAKEAGIYTDGAILEGAAFRKMSEQEQIEVVPKIQVLARSSPEDKRVLVQRLIQLGETVAVTGDGTNDVPALVTADVGFAMGIGGTEVAKEASDIVLLDDNFSSIVKAMMWGRAVNDAVKKFLQFQVTVNITAVVLAFISAVYSSEQKSVLSAVQLLWLNLIMDTFAALALATDPPMPSILDRPPERKSAPLITVNMWKMIIGQSIYQLSVTLALYFAGHGLPSFDGVQKSATNDPWNVAADGIASQESWSYIREDQLNTLIFNAFVWMQVFNQYNSRRLDNKFNIFEGIWNNGWFLGIQVLMVGLQVLIIFVGSVVFGVASAPPLTATAWGLSIAFGAGSLLWAVVLRLIPDMVVGRVIDFFGAMGGVFGARKQPEVLV